MTGTYRPLILSMQGIALVLLEALGTFSRALSWVVGC